MCGSMGGGVALIVTAAWWLTPSRPKGALPPPTTLAIRVSYEENEGWDSDANESLPATEWQLVDIGNGAELEITCTRSELLFDRIKIEAEAWPPELAGWTQNGLQSYEFTATAKLLGRRESQRKASSIARTNKPDEFKVYIPWSKSESRDAGTPKGRFSADAAGVVELAKAEAKP